MPTHCRWQWRSRCFAGKEGKLIATWWRRWRWWRQMMQETLHFFDHLGADVTNDPDAAFTALRDCVDNHVQFEFEILSFAQQRSMNPSDRCVSRPLQWRISFQYHHLLCYLWLQQEAVLYATHCCFRDQTIASVFHLLSAIIWSTNIIANRYSRFNWFFAKISL